MSAPVVVARRTLAAMAAKRWKNQYAGWADGDGSKAGVLLQLQALGPNPDPDAVDAVVGNRSWTTVPSCNGCNAADCSVVVTVGETPGYESSTAHLCEKCVLAALAALIPYGVHR
ncbi:hypothetical protein [Stenotrophomonas maltophilia]|uniref:hypothetical protein n=1 Tax=Stenotrophomonas maltophilia TaxID=40324 RepID=UPI0013D9037A|nr:hypothetical protein [Stenotrophomonas maltophilia]